jgi:hypothetical protein
MAEPPNGANCHRGRPACEWGGGPHRELAHSRGGNPAAGGFRHDGGGQRPADPGADDGTGNDQRTARGIQRRPLLQAGQAQLMTVALPIDLDPTSDLAADHGTSVRGVRLDKDLKAGIQPGQSRAVILLGRLICRLEGAADFRVGGFGIEDNLLVMPLDVCAHIVGDHVLERGDFDRWYVLD